MNPPRTPTHGTVAEYVRGCRCDGCSAARRARDKAYYWANSERERARKADWRAANPAKVRAAGARWSAANREKIHAKEAKYRAANPEKVRARHAAYRDRSRDKKSEWEGRRRARKAAATITAITAELLEQRLSMFAGCWLCGGEPTEVDHVKPLIAGGAHCLANMRPICRSCNASKGGRWPYGRKP